MKIQLQILCALLALAASSPGQDNQRQQDSRSRKDILASLPPGYFLRAGEVVLFQGDSITDGGRARTGNDHNHTMGQDYAYIIAARVGSALAERHITFLNRGISGNKVADLAARWQNDTIKLKPDVLSILIGINDSSARVPLPDFERTYDKLLADTVAALPRVRLVLCTPFILPVGRRKIDFAASRADVKQRGEIVEKLGVKYHAAVVRFQPVLDEACKRAPAESWLWDGIHPDYCGHNLLAETWLKQTAEFFYPKS